MNKQINACLANGAVLDFVGMPFVWNLNDYLDNRTERLDIYEYGMTMIVNKMYSLNIKPTLHSHLKDFIGLATWNEINATDEANRVDIDKIIELYEKYGTHISTQAFYGAAYQQFIYRERNDWESSIEVQMKLCMDVRCPIPETGMTVYGDNDDIVSQTDIDCFNKSEIELLEHRIGGNINISDMNEWFNSCTTADINTCAFLGYALCPGSDSNGGLIPLYELLDESDPRREAMQQALVKYVEAHNIILTSRPLVLIDAFGKHFSDGYAPEYLYQDYNGKRLKYFRLDEEISQHVRGVTKGKFYFYYSLGHLVDNAVVGMKFANREDIDADWKVRGDHANVGVTGILKDNYLCIRTKNVNDGVLHSEFVTGFGVRVDGKIKSISKYTETRYNWKQNGENWYKGLVHDDVYCIYTKDELKDF